MFFSLDEGIDIRHAGYMIYLSIPEILNKFLLLGVCWVPGAAGGLKIASVANSENIWSFLDPPVFLLWCTAVTIIRTEPDKSNSAASKVWNPVKNIFFNFSVFYQKLGFLQCCSAKNYHKICNFWWKIATIVPVALCLWQKGCSAQMPCTSQRTIVFLNSSGVPVGWRIRSINQIHI